MAFDNQNQLIIAHENSYYNRTKKDGNGNQKTYTRTW